MNNLNINSEAMNTVNKVNVAPSSESGHFIEKAINVINLDEVNETFVVEGNSQMTTKNHTTLLSGDDLVLVTCQTLKNPLTGMYEKAKD